VSAPATGTEITLVVPGRTIFRASGGRRPTGFTRVTALLRGKDDESMAD
jgi:hypothetical protein